MNQKISKNSNSKDKQNKNSDKNTKSNIDIGIEDLLNDLNSFLLSHKIKKSDFIDNPNVFLTFEDFIDVFKQIHYTLQSNYNNYKKEIESAACLFIDSKDAAMDGFVSDGGL